MFSTFHVASRILAKEIADLGRTLFFILSPEVSICCIANVWIMNVINLNSLAMDVININSSALGRCGNNVKYV